MVTGDVAPLGLINHPCNILQQPLCVIDNPIFDYPLHPTDPFHSSSLIIQPDCPVLTEHLQIGIGFSGTITRSASNPALMIPNSIGFPFGSYRDSAPFSVADLITSSG
jgi:hypothetical protein